MTKTGQAALIITNFLENSEFETPRMMAMINPDYLSDLLDYLTEDESPEVRQTIDDAFCTLSSADQWVICSRLKDDLYGDIVAAHFDGQA